MRHVKHAMIMAGLNATLATRHFITPSGCYGMSKCLIYIYIYIYRLSKWTIRTILGGMQW